ncbi:TPA: glycosyltransferase [Candidatus Gastranaerophilales bacterium HUM_20]|nr:n-acetylglucosaminyldiphosphoundecaprenol N-acetyl-beta-D-mannosaminyltransferase [Clostridium sp. CAG:729]DAB24687.1 MAG TPA: glycosyltransferase [Candidatus Gastranaerophilales bacterium HUM_20]
MNRKTVKLQGFNVDTFDFETAVKYADSISGQVITINPEMINNARKNSDFADIINSAELVIPDGIGVEIGLKILGNSVRRIAGIEFAHKMLEVCAKEGKSVAFVGAKPEIIEKAAENIKNEFENINIVYVQDGYFKDDERVMNDLKNLQPRLVLCALGSPKQEEFIAKSKTMLPDSLFIGVGGSFDVWSGVVQRAPEIYQKLGLEWLYRTVKEPQRFKRIFPTLPLFVLNVLREKFIPKGV